MLDNCLFWFEFFFTSQSWTVYKKHGEKPNQMELPFILIILSENSSLEEHESFGKLTLQKYKLPENIILLHYHRM